MIDHEVFYSRLGTCKACEFYRPGKCRKGHNMASPNGCPVQKFPPMPGAVYDMDEAPEPMLEHSCSSCIVDEKMPYMSGIQVLNHFATAMVRWAAAGLPVVTDTVHSERIKVCSSCPRRDRNWCSICHCLLYLKAKVATEQCPEYRWPQ